MIEIKEFKKLVEPIVGYQKLLFLMSLVTGAIYLNAYLSEFRIPFPVDLGVLPVLLVMVGALSIGFSLLGIAYVFIVSILNSDPFSTGYLRVIHTSKGGVYAPSWGNRIKFTLICYLPIIFMLVVTGLHDVDSPIMQALCWGGVLIWNLLYSVVLSTHAFTSFKERKRFSLRFSFHMIVAQMLSIASLLVLFAIVLPRMEVTNIKVLVVLGIYAGFNAISVHPAFSPRRFNIVNDSTTGLTSDELLQRSYVSPVYFFIGVCWIATLFPPVSTYVAEIPLRLLNIGGGTQFVISSGKKECRSWPDFIIKGEYEYEEKCISNVGKLILQLGDRVYAVFLNKDDKPILVSLNLEKSSILRPISEDNIFFNVNINTK